MSPALDIWQFLANYGLAALLAAADIWALVKPGKPWVVPYVVYEDMRAQRDRALATTDKATEVMQHTLMEMGDLLAILKPPDFQPPAARQHRSMKEGP